MIVRNITAFELLNGVICPHCKRPLTPQSADLNIFEGIKDEAGNADIECIKFNDWINSLLCTEDSRTLYEVRQLLEQFRQK